MPFLSPQDFINMVRLNLRTAVKTPLIGVDLGRKFVGLSLSDEKASQAYILDGFVSTESNILFDAKFRSFLQQKMVENKAKGLVIGFPFEDGAYNSMFDRMIETLSLMKDFDYPITKHDERCTTMASRKISHEIDKMHKFKMPSLANDKLFNDKVAATLILQDFCDEVHRRKK